MASSIASDFARRGQNNNSDLSQLRSTGLYVGNDHRVGSLQQIELTV